MADQKIITVFGATGAQGGGLVRSILRDSSGPFKLRAITRDPNSAKAQALLQQGAEVVAADLNDEASVTKALAGSYGAFLVTNYFEHFSPEKETQQVENVAKAAKAVGLKHMIWSTLEDTRKWVPLDDDRMPTMMQKYKTPHFDAKGQADRFFTENGVPTTFLLTSFYWDNLIHYGMGPKRDASGKVTFALPMADKKLAGIAVEDIGKCSYNILKAGEEYFNKYVGIAGGHLTGIEMAQLLSEAMGEEITYTAIPHDVYRGLGFPAAEEFGNMFQFYCDFEEYFCGIRNVQATRKLNPELLDFPAWLAANKSNLTIPTSD